MKIGAILSMIATLASAWALPADDSATSVEPLKRGNSSYVGYLGVFFLGNAPNVYFYLSKDNNPSSMMALANGSPILVPTMGTGGVRDPAIISGAGADAGKKWYIVGTDLDISKTTWDASERTGSRSIFVWESTDLINWTNERLVEVETKTAGMVWAPDAIWDPSEQKYLVYWASRFYAPSDKKHSGTASSTVIRSAYTSDFKTFTNPTTYIDASPISIIDLSMLKLSGTKLIRFLKNETSPSVYMETTEKGLHADAESWTRVGGADGVIRTGVEGPYAFRDNIVEDKINLLLDFYGRDGYHLFDTTDLSVNQWANVRGGFPKGLRHGSMLSISQTHHDALRAKWG